MRPILTRIPWHPERASVNSPSLLERRDGGVILTFFAGTWEAQPGVGLWGVVRERGVWSEPFPVHCDRAHSAGNSVMIEFNGRIWLYFVVTPGPDWTRSVVLETVSDDGGRTFADPVRLQTPVGWLVGTPALTVGGQVLVPMYDETRWESFIVALCPPGRILWTSAPLRVPGGCIQPAVCELGDGRLQVWLRTSSGRVWTSQSTDGGHGFAPPWATPLPNPNSRVAAARCGGGTVLAYNPFGEGGLQLEPGRFSSGRSILRMAFSHDGLTWPAGTKRDVVWGPGEYAYPWLVATGTDRWLMAYAHARSEIRVLEGDLDWLVARHPPPEPESWEEAQRRLAASTCEPGRPEG